MPRLPIGSRTSARVALLLLALALAAYFLLLTWRPPDSPDTPGRRLYEQITIGMPLEEAARLLDVPITRHTIAYNVPIPTPRAGSFGTCQDWVPCVDSRSRSGVLLGPLTVIYIDYQDGRVVGKRLERTKAIPADTPLGKVQLWGWRCRQWLLGR